MTVVVLVRYDLLDYPQVVHTPMDLGTVREKLRRGEYSTPHQMADDVRLTWRNCMRYNEEGSSLHIAAYR